MLTKICGITNSQDARQVISAGADWIGLNLVAGPRRIDLATVERIVRELKEPSRAVVLVSLENGVVPEPLRTSLGDLGVRRLQLYGERPEEAVVPLKAAGFESIVVVPVPDRASLGSVDELPAATGGDRPDYVLFDAARPGQLGGTGERADWEAIRRARTAGRLDRWPPFLLAGGLDPDNVGEAIAMIHPAGVDVSSGVERAPGRKDHEKVRRFIEAARLAAQQLP